MSEVFNRKTLQQLTLAHHGNPVAHVRDHGKIMAHQQIAQVPFFTNIAKQVQYLGLDGNVKRRGRLIEQKNLWLEQ
jgi:hypothetical protein